MNKTVLNIIFMWAYIFFTPSFHPGGTWLYFFMSLVLLFDCFKIFLFYCGNCVLQHCILFSGDISFSFSWINTEQWNFWMRGTCVFNFIRICQTYPKLLKHFLFPLAVQRAQLSHVLTSTWGHECWLVCVGSGCLTAASLWLQRVFPPWAVMLRLLPWADF